MLKTANANIKNGIVCRFYAELQDVKKDEVIEGKATTEQKDISDK